MFSRMMQSVTRADGQHLAPRQRQDVQEYADSLPRRFVAARTVAAAEAGLVERAVRDFGDPADLGWDTAPDDLRLAVRAIVQGMLMDDPDVAEAKVLGHLRRTLGYLDVPADAVRGLFAALRDAARATLPPDAFAVLAPYLDRTAQPTESATV